MKAMWLIHCLFYTLFITTCIVLYRMYIKQSLISTLLKFVLDDMRAKYEPVQTRPGSAPISRESSPIVYR